MHFKKFLSILLAVTLLISAFSFTSNAATVTYAEAFMSAAQSYNVSPYHLASRVIQEVGKQGSAAAHGTSSSYPGIYNLYSIGANTGMNDGLRWASNASANEKYYRPWNTPYKSLMGGAKYIAAGYISVGQSTLYTQKFDIIENGGYYSHQYMSNIQAPYSESKNVYKAYNNMGILESNFIFTIPVYENMPSSPCSLPARSSSPNMASDTAGLPSGSSIPKSGVVFGTSDGLNMRTGPSTNYAKVVTVPNGTTLNITSKSGNWYAVNCRLNGTSYSGYVSSTYVKISYITYSVPSIYQSYINQVKAEHPTWQFRFLYTGLNWADVVKAQTKKNMNVVNSQTNPISFRSTTINYNSSTNTYTPTEGSTWFQAHGQVVQHYLDPRNFITDTSVFQFEELTYVSGVHTISGVKAIIKGSFMDNKSITVDPNIEIDENRIYPDVPNDAWYYTYVKYCKEHGYMSGYSNGKFGPNDNLKRQDFAVILSQIAGANLPKYKNVANPFPDVKTSEYYGPAVAWASANGILSGYNNGKFGTGDPITREQICTIIYRYAEATFNDMTLSRSADSILSKYTDRKSVSAYAKVPMAWCIDIGLIAGKDSTHLSPGTTATRAEIATIIMCTVESGLGYKGYSDVPLGSDYYDAVQFAYHKGIMSGGEDGKFNPTRSIERQDFMIVLARASKVDLYEYEGQTGGFSDVSADSYYAPAVAWAKDINLVSGYSDGRFGVGDVLTRQQICLILYNYTQYLGKSVMINDAPDEIVSIYPDADDIDLYAQMAVAWCIENGIVRGETDGNLKPKNSVIRGELAFMIMRMAELNIF